MQSLTWTKVFHHGRKWQRAENHMDCRHCPDCGATVNGNHGQHAHRQWHIELAELLNDLSARAGIEDQPAVPWTAAVDGDSDQEAISGLQTGPQREEQPYL